MADVDKEVLEEVKNTLSQHGYANYDELRNAVESKRLLRELHGLSRARWTSWIATIGAVFSAIAALGTVIVLLYRADVDQTQRQSEFLKQGISVFETESKQAKEKKNLAVDELADVIAQRSREEIAVDLLVARRSEIEQRVSDGNSQLRELEKLLGGAQAKIQSRVEASAAASSDSVEQREALDTLRRSHEAETKRLRDRIDALSNENFALQGRVVDAGNELQAKEVELAELEKLGYVASLQSELVFRGTSFTLGDDYSVTLTNVGNIKENIDLEIVALTSRKTTNLINLDQGLKYAAKFDEKLFLIRVQEAIRSEVKSEEQGRFSVAILEGPYRLVY